MHTHGDEAINPEITGNIAYVGTGGRASFSPCHRSIQIPMSHS